MSFQEFLNKYHKNPDLTRWVYVNSKFVDPCLMAPNGMITGVTWKRLNPNSFLMAKAKAFLEVIKDDGRFDDELKRFLAFLYSIDFFW